MADTLTVRVNQRGVLTLPKSLRQAHNLKPGDTLTLIDLGNVFLLSPRHLEVDALADRIGQTLTDQGESLESMLQALREERERNAREG